MDTSAPTLDLNMLVAAGILVAAYVLIFSEVMHRTNAAIIGATVMSTVGMFVGFYPQEAAIQSVDINTLLLLGAMMMIVAMLRPTGGFEYVAIRLTKLARGDARLLLIYLSLAVSAISMFLDNVTTVIIFAPLTVLITRLLNLNPLPYLMAEAMLSNIGGTATLIGDPPNLMIGSAADIAFSQFLVHMGPPVLVAWLCTTALLLMLFRQDMGRIENHSLDLDETRAIRDPSALRRALFALSVVVILFFIHHHLHMYPALAAFVGVAIALALLRPEPMSVFGEVNWSVLMFFSALFVIVGGVESSGFLRWIGNQLAQIAREPGMLLVTSLLLMWVAALLSAVVDNIPFTVTMIPIILGLDTQGINVTPLWWALALGVGLGGNGTHIGATANVIVVAESEHSGHPDARITPVIWIRRGLPTMLLSLSVASLFYALWFSHFL
jgi:Na+/H+ antiporter NhaD/arsenite permease-like protein